MNSARAAVGVPETHETVEIGGVKLAYVDMGTGIPLVCLHATGHGGRDFLHLPALLKQDVRLIALDWPGQGRSENDIEPASASRYAEILEGLLTKLGLDRVVLLGNSIGGAAAIEYTARNPKKVIGLVLADTGGLLPVNAFTRKVCLMMSSFFRAGVKGRKWYGPAFRFYYSNVLKKGPIVEHRERIVAAAYAHAPALAEAWESFAQPNADIRSLAPSISCPTLVAWAKHDRVISFKQCLPAIELFPNAEVALFNGGHCAFLEDAPAFAQHLDGFLAKVQETAVLSPK